MKRLAIACIISCLFSPGILAQANKISAPDLAMLRALDDSLGEEGGKMLDAQMPADRMRADSLFTRMLVRAMRIPYSFHYPFDSILTAPILYPADSSFRIITWHYALKDDEFHQKGAIQMNTPDGSLKLFPLFDASEFTEKPEDSLRSNRQWIGAVYYAIIQNMAGNKPVYTLLGYDENNNITTRKWIDILTFTDTGEPQWGGHEYFSFDNDTLFSATQQRYAMEYKKDGRARLNFDPDEKMIIMDNLVSETGEPEKKYTLIPGGDYEGLKWEKDKWVHIDKLFTDSLGDGNEPKPALILADSGTPDEEALQKQSDKNMEKTKPGQVPANKPATAPKKKKG